MNKLSESAIEKAVCRTAKNNGWWAIKMNLMGVTGFPDRMFLGAGMSMFFVEFKAPGKKPRPMQQFMIKKLTNLGFKVYVIDNIEKGNDIVSKETSLLPAQSN